MTRASDRRVLAFGAKLNGMYREAMLLLIDYDNVGQSERRVGLEHVLRKSVSLIDDPSLGLTSVRARLYGGWYEGGLLTRLGQTLAAELREISPVRYASPHSTSPIFIRGELATSILAAPRALITNTFRKKGFPRNLRCESRPWLACADNVNCRLAMVERFITNNSCGSSGCNAQPSDVLHKQEQKVVDSMMVADLIEHASENNSLLGIVSRDDDMWPGIYMASRIAQAVVHVSTDRAQRVPRYYDALPSPPYRRVNWS